MGRKRKNDITSTEVSVTSQGSAKKKTKKQYQHSDSEYSDNDDSQVKLDPSVELDASVMPPKEVLYKLLDRIEANLPKEDHVKYDSRVKKLDWERIKFDELSGEECQKYWYYIQERIRRFRILAELIPDARTWISQPWTNFYKSKDHNRHPDMPKKPLSMYMLFYSEKREQILSENTSLSMPEVAKICSEQYQKLSEKKKAKYKQRCDEMRKVYEQKLRDFYEANPGMRPVKAEKQKKVPPQNNTMQVQEPMYFTPIIQQQQPQPMMVYTGTGNEQMYVVPAPQQQQQPRAMTSYPPPQVMAQVQPQIQQNQQAPHQQPQQMGADYSSAPEKPAKPYDLYFKQMMDSHAGDPNFDRASAAELYRKEWKEMKLKKKAKWIKKASDMFREYEEKVSSFCEKNPGYVKPTLKNFLTQDDQRILDKFMGRPEKPPSSAYSLFSKEMLNNIEIKKFPSKERMAQISEKWKILPQDQKDCYQGEVNRSMGVYRQRYEDWFNGLTESEREVETARLNSNKSKGKPTVPKIKPDKQILQQAPQQLQQTTQINLANLTPVMVPGMPGLQMSQPISIVQTIPGFEPATMVMPIVKSERSALLNSILAREPQEPARSPKQLFISEYVSKSKKKKKALMEARDVWKSMDKRDKKKWNEKLEPQRQKYIDEYTLFVRGLDKEELEMYTELKQKRDEEEEANRANESSDSESETSESESESDSESDSD